MDNKVTILIIDDDPSLLVGLTATIRRQGYEVITAGDGARGFQIAKEKKPDLIISDVMMPPPNGLDMRRQMSRDPDLASIPFIFLTARSGLDDRLTGIREGADDYITKPFVTEELMARIQAILRRVRAEQARGREQMKAIVQGDMERFRQEVLQNFRHELRTPLTNSIMALETVVSGRFDDPQEQSRFLRMAISSMDRLESLVTDFILLTDMDHSRLNTIRQPIDVETHILHPIRKRLERYKTRDLQFIPNVQGNGGLAAPRRELTHALVHLADNAFKFSPEKGKVSLSLLTEPGGETTFDFRDESPGIPVDLREKVFERYFQISQGDNRQYEGLGVGLTLARAIFRNLGGDVVILDEPTGCHVRATLPEKHPGDAADG